ncbi:thymidylate synthase [Nitrospirillum amazonense]|uniref:Thymidylate synthase n=1 Tax=Nitrospirillum amazonense TaxID=28077 RepID=A0A560FI61_9PROT|nr:thymidylate synthase [Nitrospirillum amazonense]TWB21287.1 thymidylate synthase [Nitrospirillum amazonense]
MAHPEYQYLSLLRRLIDQGAARVDRTGVGTKALFGEQMRFDLSAGFPLLTTKKIFHRQAIHEMLWFLSGDTSIRPLLVNKVRIWTDWPLANYRRKTGEDISQEDFEARVLADEAFAAQWGDLGPVYGKQWRRWQGPDGKVIDQIQELVDGIRTNPTSRRLLFTGWNVADLPDMALPPCHMTYQFFVADGKLSGLIFQRSADTLLGLPWNLCEGALLIHMLAHQCDLGVGDLVWQGGDVHLYLNHIPQAEEQLTREPRPFPQLVIKRKPDSLFDYRFEDFEITGYDPHAHIKADVAV